MKGFIRKILLSVSLLLIMNIQVGAVTLPPPNVQLLGDADGLVNLGEDNMFLYFDNMTPGDSVVGTIEIKNEYEYPYELFFRANRVSETEKYDLLNKLDLKITYKDKVIYAGPTSGENKLTDDISLGIFQPNQKELLTAEVSLDGPSTGNEYKNKTAEVNWIFTALRSNEVDINPEINSDIKPDNKPSSTKPIKTGDNSMIVFVILGLVSILVILLSSRKKKGGE